MFFLVGTYTDRPGKDGRFSEGIYGFELTEAYAAVRVNLLASCPNPSWLLCDGSENFLYVAEEASVPAISVWRLDSSSTVTFLQRIPTPGRDPCHLAFSADNKTLFSAQYSGDVSGGTVAAFSIGLDGLLSLAATYSLRASFDVDESRWLQGSRQEAPHAHMVLPSLSGTGLMVCDLGSDCLHVLDFDSGPAGKGLRFLSLVELPPGSGPRHALYNQKKSLVYVLSELSPVLDVYRFIDSEASLAWLSRFRLVPEEDVRFPGSAALTLRNDGQKLYCSLRGDFDVIVSFDLDQEGLPIEASRLLYPAAGKHPRHCAYLPNLGLLVAAMEASCISFLDEKGGTHAKVSVPVPTHVLPLYTKPKTKIRDA